MKESEQLLAQGLPFLNESLKAKGRHSIEAVPALPTRRRLVLAVTSHLNGVGRGAASRLLLPFSGLPDAFDRLLTISVLARLLHGIAQECELID